MRCKSMTAAIPGVLAAEIFAHREGFATTPLSMRSLVLGADLAVGEDLDLHFILSFQDRLKLRN